MSIYLKTI